MRGNESGQIILQIAIGSIIAGLITPYGVYKAAVITNIALTQGWSAAVAADSIVKGINTAVTKAQTAAHLKS